MNPVPSSELESYVFELYGSGLVITDVLSHSYHYAPLIQHEIRLKSKERVWGVAPLFGFYRIVVPTTADNFGKNEV